MSKKLFGVVLALSLVLAMIPACGTAYADPVLSEKYAANQFEAHPDFSDEPADSPYYDEMEWECGDGVYAHYCVGELAIESNGEGIIDDYDNADHPWKDYEKYITRLNVYGDLKYIGNEAFADLINLQEAYIRGDVEKFGNDIFWNCPSNMELWLVVKTEEDMNMIQTNTTWLKIDECLKGAGIGCYILYEGDIEGDQGNPPREEEGIIEETCIEGDNCEELVDTNLYDGDDDGLAPDATAGTASADMNVLNNKKTGEVISINDFKGLSCCAYYTGKKITFNLKAAGLKANRDYKITYKNNRSVGQAEIIIKGKGNYTGTINAYFNIKPKGTSLKSVRALKKGLKVQWNKQSKKMSKKRITGYQIQVATNSDFTKNEKKINIKGYKKTSAKISKLKGGKKYYVRIRTCTKTKGQTYYSRWSKVKTVKTRR